MLELLAQCSCTGISEQDLGRRAGLMQKAKNLSKKKRRAARSGMGNYESEYDEEYDSEFDYGSEIEVNNLKYNP